ncbi:MAG: sigma-54-dependent transcriptional regulator [Magnetovibrionaceae bacterium]
MSQSRPLSLLLVEDDAPMARLYQTYLEKGEPAQAYDLRLARDGKSALEALAGKKPDILLLDLKLPDMDGFEILRHIASEGMDVTSVVITGHASMTTAIEAMQLGARDFLVKPFAKERLLTTLRNAGERHRLKAEVEQLREMRGKPTFEGFIGSSPEMQAVYSIVSHAARSKASVFITGPSGTGKEVCAEAIHAQSARNQKPFIALNCSAIPGELMESELFGHVKGAFTGAVQDREGALAQADGGTLFLDEIGEMDISLQPKLLRVLQTGRYQRVGETRERAVDIRLVSATNRDPMAEIQAGRFREDLYYRLHVLPIPLPPLADRGDDCLEIARHFLAQFSSEENKAFEQLSKEVEAIFRAYNWPGNVRELQNVIRNVVVMNDGEAVTPDMLPAPLDRITLPDENAVAAPFPKQSPVMTDRDDSSGQPRPNSAEEIRPLADLERDAIQDAIRLCDGNVPMAAVKLGISSATIYRKKQAWLKETG